MATRWPCAASAVVELGDRSCPAPQRHRHLRRLRSSRSPPARRPTRTPGTGPPRVPEPGDRDRAVAPTSSANARQIHAPSATAAATWRSPQPAGLGSTLPGLASPRGSNASRSAAWAARSTGREHQRHQVALLQPDAVLAAEHPAGLDRHPHDLLAGRVHALHHAGLAAVVDEQRVQVAVAGVEHVEHEQVVAGGDLVHLRPAPPGSSRPRHHRVVQVVVRLDPGDRAERRLAPLPQQRPLGLVGGDAHRAHAVRSAAIAVIALGVGLDAVGQPDDLDEQRRRRVDRQPGVDVRLDGLQAQLVHHLHRRRHDAGGDDGAHRRRAGLDRRRSPSASCTPPAGPASGARRPWWRSPNIPSLPTNTPRRS